MAHDFYKLGLRPDLIQGLTELGIQNPTPIQTEVIPLLLSGQKNLIAQAQTGTGKTLAFGAPLIEKMSAKDSHIQGLVVAPTRELAKQIGKQLFRYTKHYDDKIFIEVASGGEKLEQQVKALSRPTQILVATPGRLLDLLKKGLSLGKVRFVVLDEADEMLSLGFQKELREIADATQSREGLWLFSATFQQKLHNFIADFLPSDTKRIKVDDKQIVNANISHHYVICSRFEKDDWIANYLKSHPDDRGILFCRTRAGAIRMGESLEGKGMKAAVIQGDLSQKDRDKVMRSFKRGDIQTLIATDVAARGIDVENLNFVLHHQLPEAVQYYTHRSGRTARAGKKGVSIALIEPEDRERLKKIEVALLIQFEGL